MAPHLTRKIMPHEFSNIESVGINIATGGSIRPATLNWSIIVAGRDCIILSVIRHAAQSSDEGIMKDDQIKYHMKSLSALCSVLTFPLSLLMLFVCLFLRLEPCASQEAKMTVSLWKQDLQQLHADLVNRHPMPYRKITKAQLDSAFEKVIENLPSLDKYHILAEIQKLVSSIGDGHTSCFPDGQPGFTFRSLPVRFWKFEDGVFPVAIAEEYKTYVNQRLVGIGKCSVEEAFQKISLLVGADNPKEYDYTVPDLLIIPELLMTLGITDSSASVKLVFEDALGKQTDVHMPAISSDQYDNNTRWVASRSDLGSVPSISLRRLFCNSFNQSHLKEDYWYTVVDSCKAVYLEYAKSVYLEDTVSLYKMFDDVIKVLDSHREYRLVIDLRSNSGGEPTTAEYLIKALTVRPYLLRKGKVIELVSRRTFSAANTTSVHLRKYANAIVIGEHPRGKPNCPSEGRDIVLRNSHIIITVSTEFVERDPDLRDSDYLPLDKEVSLTFLEYRSGKDTVLTSAFTYGR